MSDAPQFPTIPGLSIASNVHYVLSEDPENPLPIEDRHRAAIITNVIDPERGLVELAVFLQRIDAVTTAWPGPVMQVVPYYSEDPMPDTWHFLEYVP